MLVQLVYCNNNSAIYINVDADRAIIYNSNDTIFATSLLCLKSIFGFYKACQNNHFKWAMELTRVPHSCQLVNNINN